MVHARELKHVKDWTVNKIKNHIWMATNCGQPVPGNVSVEALRAELMRRGEEPVGHHDT